MPTPFAIPVCKAASRASFEGYRMVMATLVLPSSSEKTTVLRVSGQSPPQDSVETTRSGGFTSRYIPRISISVPSARRHTKCHAPPGRRSISQTGIVHPGGPSIHWGTYLGLVHASKTSRRGALKIRRITTSRSLGVVTCKVAESFMAAASWLLISFPQSCDIDLLHLQHGLHHALRLRGVLILHHLAQRRRDDLPGKPVLVLQPAASFLLPTLGELLPQLIDFPLRFAIHEERYGRRERKVRPSIQGHELLSFKLKGHRHHFSTVAVA